jgi:hypothetical protein
VEERGARSARRGIDRIGDAMASRQYQTDVASTATVIDGTQFPGFRLIHNGTNTVYLGDSSVTASDGYPLDAGDVLMPQDIAHASLRGRAEDRLYGIVASGTEDVRVLVDGRINP